MANISCACGICKRVPVVNIDGEVYSTRSNPYTKRYMTWSFPKIPASRSYSRSLIFFYWPTDAHWRSLIDIVNKAGASVEVSALPLKRGFRRAASLIRSKESCRVAQLLLWKHELLFKTRKSIPILIVIKFNTSLDKVDKCLYWLMLREYNKGVVWRSYTTLFILRAQQFYSQICVRAATMDLWRSSNARKGGELWKRKVVGFTRSYGSRSYCSESRINDAATATGTIKQPLQLPRRQQVLAKRQVPPKQQPTVKLLPV